WVLPDYVKLGLEDWSVRHRQWVMHGIEASIILGGVGAVFIVSALLFWFAPTFDRWFERFTKAYERSLYWALKHRTIVLAGIAALLVPAYLCIQATGQELFPDVDSSEFTMHVRASGGPRVEETERQIEQIEKMVAGYQASAAELAQEVALAVLLKEP